MIPRFSIQDFEFFTHPTRTRFPFRYGIASMTDVPHQFLRVRLQLNNETTIGLASEGLPPKWFTKDPATTFAQDLPAMLEVIGHAAMLAGQIAARPVSFFAFWRELYQQQNTWAVSRAHAALLANLGVSLIERAVLDAFCRALMRPLHQVIRENLLGVKLGHVYPELGEAEPRALLPAQPLDSLLARHTVGLTDPLTPADIPAAERLDDGLPHDLEANVRAYGLRAFKIKLSGNAAHDLERLRTVQAIIKGSSKKDLLITLDGNENFKSFADFRAFWEQVRGEPTLEALLANVIAVEQPVHRDHALSEDAGEGLRNWADRPPLIIDESEAALGDLPRALALGYIGTSHKNCKGIVKGLANACLVAKRSQADTPLLLTGEDLANLGPVALLQDLAMMALLGIEHVERNGHHYFRGLSLWPEAWSQTMLAAHGDLYERHKQGFAHLKIRAGRIQLGTINTAPFGVQPLFDPSAFARAFD